ncbi:MAG TPA: GIDE domain-containing protein [Candidatus Acidoferrales bacterium]
MLSAFGTVLLLYSHQSDMVKLQFWAAVGAIAGVFLFLRGFSMLRCKRLILNTPSSKIRSASMGLVEISGTAKGPQTVHAGITGEACYYYRAMAWQLRQSGRNSQWKKVADESLYVPFFIEDATGDALVDPQGAELDIHRNFKDEFGTSFFSSRDMMPENVNAFLLRYGVSGSEKIRLEEYCIKPGDPLFVLGTLCQNADAARWTPCPHFAAPGSSLKSRLSFCGPTGSSMFRTLGWASGLKVPMDANVKTAVSVATQSASSTAGSWSSVSLEEEAMHAMSATSNREVAGAAATNAPQAASAVASVETETAPPEANVEAQSATGFDTHPSVAIGKGTNREFFMISWHSQREVVRSLAWKSALCIWGGPALTLACVYLLVLSLGWT